MTNQPCREKQPGVEASAHRRTVPPGGGSPAGRHAEQCPAGPAARGGHGGHGGNAAPQRERAGSRSAKPCKATHRQGRRGSRAALGEALRRGGRGIGVLTPHAGTAALYLLGCIAVGLVAADFWQRGDHVGAVLMLLVPPPVVHFSARRAAAGRRSARAAVQGAAVQAFLRAIEVKDPYTRGHSERVAEYSAMIGRRLGLPEDRVTVLSHAAALHDVGKLGVPSTLLRKTGPLDHGEYAEMRQHAKRGADLVRGLDFSGEVRDAVLHHHEWLDGTGYPDGLAGSRIPYFARIIGVADAYDAMTSTRPYRVAMPVRDALAELRRCAGSQFDPAAVEALEGALGELELDRESARLYEFAAPSASPSEPTPDLAAEPAAPAAPCSAAESDESVLYNARV
jgi:putative nucleotidyltransferase with HDIG domain